MHNINTEQSELQQNEDNIRLFISSIANGIFEIRAFGCEGNSIAYRGWTKNIVSGYFDKIDCAVRCICDLEKYSSPTATYITLNPVNPALLARAANRMQGSPKATTADKDIVVLRHLLLDFDPVRPSGISSSDDELEAAMELRDKVIANHTADGWEPLITGMSGNGGHAIYRLPDLEPSEKNIALIKRALAGISEKFSTEKVSIDTAVFNPGRITKVLGTIARKGDCIPSRPHRLSYVDGGGANG